MSCRHHFRSMKYRTSTYGYICQPSEFSREHLYYTLGMGYIINDRNFLVDRDTFPGHLVMYCISGLLHIEQYNVRSTLSPGQCCLMTLEDAHKYYSDTEKPCELLWLHFNGKHAHELLDLIFDHRSRYVLIEQTHVLSLLQNCILNYESDSTGSCIINSANTYQILSIFLDQIVRAEKQETVNISPLAKHLDSYLGEHIHERITLDMMAQQCHLSSAYFCRRFRLETNMTPMQYLMHRRIELAKYALIYTPDQISQISQELGFYDQNHFSFCFHKATGISPTQYRKQHIKIKE